MTDEQKKLVDWKTVAAETALALGLPAEDLTQEVQRELMAQLAKDITKTALASLKSGGTWGR